LHGGNGIGMGWMNVWGVFGIVVVIGVLWLVFEFRPPNATGRLPLGGFPKRRYVRESRQG
jgi:hypothetical protein